jgi:mRNA interferase RelE/StbE
VRRRVIWELPAVEQLLTLAKTDRESATRIVAGVRRFAAGDGGDVKKLQGRSGEWRLRVGDWRVIFTADPALDAIDVLAVLNRRDAYD